MRGIAGSEMDVTGLSADEVWKVWGSHDIVKLMLVDLLPGVFTKMEYVKGNGGVGSVLHCVLPEGNPKEWTEMYVKLDNHKRMRVINQVEGGYLDLGFTLYQSIYEIIHKDCNSCTIRMTTKFDLDEKFIGNASLVTVDSSWMMAEAVVKYAREHKSKNTPSADA